MANYIKNYFNVSENFTCAGSRNMVLKVLDRTKIKHFETNSQLARRVDLKIELKSNSG